MNAKKYCVGDTLVILMGQPEYDPYQNCKKDPETYNKIFKHIAVHLVGNIPEENYELENEIMQVIRGCPLISATKRQSLQTKTIVTYYLHDNWSFPNPGRVDTVRNQNTIYELGKLVQPVNDRDIYMYEAYKYQAR